MTMTNYSQTELQSKTIDFLRFPLIIIVLFGHAVTSAVFQNGYVNTGGEGLFWYDNIKYIISNILAYLTITSFFFMSGFLFFNNIKSWTIDKYKSKIKNRFRTLLIPYILWNIIAIVIILIAYHGISALTPGKAEGNLFSFKNIIGMFWNYSQTGNPVQIPLWYIRNLMILMLLSPVIWLWVKYLRIYGVAILGLIYISHIAGSIYNYDESVFMFSLGAYFGINKINFITSFNKIFTFSVFAYPIMVLADLCTRNQDFNIYIHNAGILIGVVFVFNIVSKAIEKKDWHISSKIADSTFFIYASHYYVLSFFRRAMIYIVKPDSEVTHFIVYFVPVILTLCVVYAVYLLMRKVTPGFLGILCGGRD